MNKRKALLATCKHGLFLLLSVVTFNCWAWWGVGHMVVANIAYQHLNTAARNKVDMLVSEFTKGAPTIDSFEKMALWPDILYGKEKIRLTFNWHFVDTPYIVDDTQSKVELRADNIVWALDAIIDAIKKNQVSSYESARLLAFLIHFVGDIHQPLHNVSLVSAIHPEGDAGGNGYQVIFNEEKVNLHRVWDSGFGELSGEETIENVEKISREITRVYPIEHFRKDINKLQPLVWSKESYLLAVNYVYKASEGKPLDNAYVSQGKHFIKREVALAGYRLAILLNRLYSSGCIEDRQQFPLALKIE